MTWARPRVAVAILTIAGFVVLVGLGFGMTFFSDEWAFIETRSLADPGTWLIPHNEHWVVLPVLVYRTLVETIGIGSYVPYQALVVLLHLIVAILAYRLLERSTHRAIALVGFVLVVFLGGGFENVYWGFQVSFVGSTLFGLAAMIVTDGPATARRAWAVALLLLASLACSGVGVVLCIAVGAEWVLDRRWRSGLPILLAPALGFLTWYVTLGRSGVTTQRDPFTLAALGDVPRFVADGAGSVLRVVTGLPPELGAVVAAALIAVVVFTDSSRARSPRLIGIVVAIIAQYALAGLVRAHLFEGIAEYTRYTYTSAILGIVAIGCLVGRPDVRHMGGRARLAFLTGIAVWAALALVLNVRLLLSGREIFLARADMTRALVTVALDPDQPPGVDPKRSLVLVPAPDELRRIVALYGDPRTDALVPGSVRPIPPEILAEARRRLIEGAPIP